MRFIRAFYCHLIAGFTDVFQRPTWWLKQWLPLTYWTTYRTNDGVRHFHIWRMWFGQTFDQTSMDVS